MAVKGPQSCLNYSFLLQASSASSIISASPWGGGTCGVSQVHVVRGLSRQTEGQTAHLDMDMAPPQEWKRLNRALAVGLFVETPCDSRASKHIISLEALGFAGWELGFLGLVASFMFTKHSVPWKKTPHFNATK